jgi:hypothetical protein
MKRILLMLERFAKRLAPSLRTAPSAVSHQRSALLADS